MEALQIFLMKKYYVKQLQGLCLIIYNKIVHAEEV